MAFMKGVKLSSDRLLRVTQAAKQAGVIWNAFDEGEPTIGLQSDIAIAFGSGSGKKW
jgi:hypothetical protein